MKNILRPLPFNSGYFMVCPPEKRRHRQSLGDDAEENTAPASSATVKRNLLRICFLIDAAAKNRSFVQ